MSSQHKAPLAAFLVVSIACIVVLVNAVRGDALTGLFEHPSQSIVSGARLVPQPVEPLDGPLDESEDVSRSVVSGPTLAARVAAKTGPAPVAPVSAALAPPAPQAATAAPVALPVPVPVPVPVPAPVPAANERTDRHGHGRSGREDKRVGGRERGEEGTGHRRHSHGHAWVRTPAPSDQDRSRSSRGDRRGSAESSRGSRGRR